MHLKSPSGKFDLSFFPFVDPFWNEVKLQTQYTAASELSDLKGSSVTEEYLVAPMTAGS